MLKYNTKKVIEVSDWDNLVEKTYNKPYSFQQQEGCQERGNVSITINKEEVEDEFTNDTLPEKVNGEEMGVSFSAWLDRDPKQKLNNPEYQEDYCTILFWERNFYPSLQVIANDLCRKGLIEEGDYAINIDW